MNDQHVETSPKNWYFRYEMSTRIVPNNNSYLLDYKQVPYRSWRCVIYHLSSIDSFLPLLFLFSSSSSGSQGFPSSNPTGVRNTTGLWDPFRVLRFRAENPGQRRRSTSRLFRYSPDLSSRKIFFRGVPLVRSSLSPSNVKRQSTEIPRTSERLNRTIPCTLNLWPNPETVLRPRPFI